MAERIDWSVQYEANICNSGMYEEAVNEGKCKDIGDQIGRVTLEPDHTLDSATKSCEQQDLCKVAKNEAFTLIKEKTGQESCMNFFNGNNKCNYVPELRKDSLASIFQMISTAAVEN